VLEELLLLLLTLPQMSVLDLAILCLSLVCFFSMHLMHIQSVSPLANWLGRVGFSKKKKKSIKVTINAHTD
jgi:hypothetical protein